MSDQLYTLDQIAQAFAATFHKSGEVWFNYLGPEEDCEESTRAHWDEFMENLKNAS